MTEVNPFKPCACSPGWPTGERHWCDGLDCSTPAQSLEKTADHLSGDKELTLWRDKASPTGLPRKGLGAKCVYSDNSLSFWQDRSRAVAQVGLPQEALGRKGGNCGEGMNGRTCYSIATWRLDKRDSDDTEDWAPVHTIKLWPLRKNASFLQLHGKRQLVHTFRRNIFSLLGQNCYPAIF